MMTTIRTASTRMTASTLLHCWRRANRVLMLAVLIAVLAVTAPTAGPIQAQRPPDVVEPLPLDAWAPLGPTGPATIEAVGVSSGWPDDPFILVRRSVADWVADSPASAHPAPAARSYDGGQTWEPLPARTPGGRLTVIQTATFGRLAFALPGRDDGGERVVSRSTDDGLTWEPVQSSSRMYARLTRLIASPDVYHDGHLLLAGDGQLRQSLDAGATWNTLDPLPGQTVQDAIFSPDFARDRTIYAVATAGEYPSVRFSDDADPTEVATRSERSAGVIVSRDAGLTWEPASNGLEADGGSFRLIQALGISPTFARDGTLFAFGWETYPVPLFDGKSHATVRRALFRSQDRGLNWQVVQRPAGRITKVESGTERAYAAIALAPDFADSGSVMMTVNSNYGSPGSSGCMLNWSADGGDTWAFRSEVSSYGGCRELQFGGLDAHMATWYASASGGSGSGSWRMSPDGGEHYAALSRRMSLSLADGAIAVARDGTLFVGGLSGVWAIGPSAVQTEGRLPCQYQEAGPLATSRQLLPGVRVMLGCPVSETYSVMVRERRLADQRDLWLEDDSPSWLSLGPPDRFSGDAGAAGRLEKEKMPWTGPPDRVMPRDVQRFEGGLILYLAEPDGSWSALVVGGRGWQMIPEEVMP